MPTARPSTEASSRASILVVAVLVLGLVAAVALGTRWLADALAGERCVFEAAGRTVELTPEQTAHAGTIAGIAAARGLPPRAATIALATALQESKLRNLTYGDADSEGLFQQRPSQGWGTAEQVKDPVYAANAFYDALVRVPGWQEGVITEVAQAVQRSAYPDAYADHEWEGRVLASVLTGQEGTGTVMGCDLDAPTERGSARTLATHLSNQLGLEGTVDEGSSTVTVELGDPALAWSVATWAVTQAADTQVDEVRVGGYRWQRSEGPLRWQEVGADVALPATTVVVSVH